MTEVVSVASIFLHVAPWSISAADICLWNGQLMTDVCQFHVGFQGRFCGSTAWLIPLTLQPLSSVRALRRRLYLDGRPSTMIMTLQPFDYIVDQNVSEIVIILLGYERRQSGLFETTLCRKIPSGVVATLSCWLPGYGISNAIFKHSETQNN